MSKCVCGHEKREHTGGWCIGCIALYAVQSLSALAICRKFKSARQKHHKVSSFAKLLHILGVKP